MALCQFAFCSITNDAPAAHVTGATCENMTPTATSAPTTASSAGGQSTCRVATDTAIYVSFGTAPNATSDTVRFLVPAGAVEYFRVQGGYKAAAVLA